MVSSERNLIVPVKFELSRYESLGDGERHEWTHRRRKLRTLGLIAILTCRLDPHRFSLRLEFARGGTTICDEEILEPRPDELILAHRFEDVIERRDTVVVTDSFGGELYAVPAEKLGMR